MTTKKIEDRSFVVHPEWAAMERDVVDRIRFLAAYEGSIPSPRTGLHKKIWDDLVMPNLILLAEFCANVDIDKEKSATDQAALEELWDSIGPIDGQGK